MVVGVVRAVGPPSTMRGSLSPSCSRTPKGVVHSGRPERFAEVAVMGRPRRVTTARGRAASGARGAGLPGLAGTRSGRLLPGLSTMGRGPGQNFSAGRAEGGRGWGAGDVGPGDS